MLSFLTPYLLWIKLAGVALLMIGAAYCGYRWELGAYNGLVAADAIASTKAVQTALDRQKAVDANNQIAAVADVLAQQKIVTNTLTVTKEITHYVNDTVACPGGTYGFVRLLVASERGADPANLSLPAGVTDDTCSPLEPSALAADLVADFGAANGNAQQLNGLIASVRANDETATKP